ncbi:MAG: PAS domain-containing protein [Elsteraceae bacterium]
MPSDVSLPPSADAAIYQPALAWWLETVARLGRLPARSDLDPTDLGVKALPHALIVEIVGAGEDFRFRLIGTNHSEFNRRDLTGLLFSQVYPIDSPVLAYLKGLYAELMTSRRPLWSLNEFLPPTRNQPIRMGRLMLPMSSNGDLVDFCVAVQKIDAPKSATIIRHPWQEAEYTGEIERQSL